MNKLKNICRWSADKISGRILIVLIVLSVLVFGAFYLIGYDTPFEEDANFNAPLFTDVVLGYLYFLLFACLVVSVVSVVRGLRQRDASTKIVNGIPAFKIAYGSVALLVASMALTFAFGSSEPVRVNGVAYTDTFWLKATDMFINTSIILIVVALAAVGYGLLGYNRRLHIRKGGR